MRAIAVLLALPLAAQVTYRASDENFPNPERGFYIQRRTDPPANRSANVTADALRKARAEGMTLLRLYFVLKDYRDKPLDNAALARMSADLDTVREAGAKVVLRFGYNFGPVGEADAPAELVLKHLDQLRPMLRANTDIIAFVEAGFVGTWGEWHSSTNELLDPKTKTVNEKTRAIMDKWFDVLPASRMIALRYPRAKFELTGTAPLTEAEAFSGTPKARLGAHNDCFLSSSTDVGTYTTKNIDAEKAFYRADNRFVPQGGETCGSGERAQPYIGCANALEQLAAFHYTTLNIGYEKNVIEGWRKGGCMAEIERRMGYRFRLISSDAPAQVRAGGSIALQLQLANDGFGVLYNQRPVNLVLRGKGQVYRLRTTLDPRRWAPGAERKLTADVAIPVNVEPGEYELLLELPDDAPTLAARPDYSIRLANEGLWEPATGFNTLRRQLSVR